MRIEPGYGDDDRLPWLETVEEEYRDGPSFGRLLLLGFLLLLVIAAGAGVFYWYANQKGLTGSGQLITAPTDDYKIKPDEPGGRVVDGEGDTVFSTSQGNVAHATINPDALPEAPVEGSVVAKAKASVGTAEAQIAVPKPVAEKPKVNLPVASSAPRVGGSGSIVQLGAFPSEGGANSAWARLSKRFSYLEPLGRSVERGETEDKVVWRLRVNAGSNAQARDICGKLKIAGENCYIAN